MRIVMMAQEEPVYMGPYLIEVMRARAKDVVALAIAPQRSIAGKETDDQRKAMWLMLEPWSFLKAIATRGAAKLTGWRSLEAAARRLGIPVIRFEKANDPEFLNQLRALNPDIVFNQSELLLKEEILKLPRLGVVNRHGSWLPKYRGRVGSWWAHAAGEKEIGITVHFVDSGIDSGPIIHQESFPSDPRWSYGRVIERLFRLSPAVVLRGFEKLERADFEPIPNEWQKDGSPARKFPTMDEVLAYRAALAERRRS
ncbi:MAG TPA: formyltransferase family protein [Planctomycetota bacterium]|nr:formyltransferase family protein [Planctomycetota bacterium]